MSCFLFPVRDLETFLLSFLNGMESNMYLHEADIVSNLFYRRRKTTLVNSHFNTVQLFSAALRMNRTAAQIKHFRSVQNITFEKSKEHV